MCMYNFDRYGQSATEEAVPACFCLHCVRMAAAFLITIMSEIKHLLPFRDSLCLYCEHFISMSGFLSLYCSFLYLYDYFYIRENSSVLFLEIFSPLDNLLFKFVYHGFVMLIFSPQLTNLYWLVSYISWSESLFLIQDNIRILKCYLYTTLMVSSLFLYF